MNFFIEQKKKRHKIFIKDFPQFLLLLSPLGHKYLSQFPVLATTQPLLFPCVIEQIPHRQKRHDLCSLCLHT